MSATKEGLVKILQGSFNAVKFNTYVLLSLKFVGKNECVHEISDQTVTVLRN